MTNNDIYGGLNEQQLLAVNCSLGNKLILAGAGSGKTRVLIYRVAKLIDSFGIKPSNILALTFTNKASNEMKQRLEKLLKISAQSLWFGTFHGICRRILKIHWKEAGIKDHFNILDSQDQLRMIKRIIKSQNLDENFYDPKSLQSFINTQKDKGRRYDTSTHDDETYINIFKQYDSVCRQINSVDFADLILLTYEMFKKNNHILNYYSNRFKNIMVDEFQDTNALQFNLLKLINGNSGSLYVVGDDDQSIYGWRGARSKNIKDFADTFKNVEIFKLEQNYRSTNEILSVANSLIEKNTSRMGKNLWTDATKGNPVYLYEAINEYEERDFIIDKIEELVSNGYKRSEIALLYRSNFLSRKLEKALNSRSIPYQIYGGFRFFERAEIKDVIAYLRIATNVSDDISFERTINNPTRGIGDKTIQIIRDYAKLHSLSLWESINQLENIEINSSRAKSSLKSYIDIINQIKELINNVDLKDLIQKIIEVSELNKHYESKKTEESLSRLENLEELISTAKEFSNYNAHSENIVEDFLDNVALEAGEYQSKPHEDPVQLMTIHSSKGLEFPIVFITALEEGIFPNENRNIKSGFLEEERRLCYVAITRAMKTLYLTYSRDRNAHGTPVLPEPSRFIEEIPEHLLETIKTKVNSKVFTNYRKPSIHPKSFNNNVYSQDNFNDDFSQEQNYPFIKPGQKVNHMKFGHGVILSYTGEKEDLKLHINFERYGKKWLVLSYAQLEFIN